MANAYKIGDAIEVLISLGKNSDPQKGSEQTYSVESCLPSTKDPDVEIWSYTKISPDLHDVAPTALRIGVSKSTGKTTFQRGEMSDFHSKQIVEFEFLITNIIKK